jgi:hypothetical protein
MSFAGEDHTLGHVEAGVDQTGEIGRLGSDLVDVPGADLRQTAY